MKRFISYVKDYGKPKEGQTVNYGGAVIALAIIIFLTWLAFHYGVWYLSLLLIGEYKENYEIFRYLDRKRQ